jgi:hypothetical protein
LARQVLLPGTFAEVLVRPPLTRRHLPGVVLEPIRLGQHEPLHVPPVYPARVQETGHGVATEEWQGAAKQNPIEARERPLELVGVLRDELVHSRIGHELE